MLDMQRIRSLLYVPLDRTHMIEKALNSQADCVILDLEDAIAPEMKEAARANLSEYAKAIQASGKPAIVRVNGADTQWFALDLQTVVESGIETIIVPKVEAGVVALVASALDQMGPNASAVKIIPLIESPAGCVELDQILRESPRVVAAQLGAEDLTKSLDIPRTSESKEIEYIRNVMAMTCHARGKVAIDTPYTDIRNDAGLRADTLHVKNIGFQAKTCIHPGQIAAINEILCPTQAQISLARRIVAYAADEAAGMGSFMFEGKMVDTPVVKRMERVLAKAETFGLLSRDEAQGE